MIAFYFLIKNLHTGNKFFLIFSLLAFSLAIGTKQNALFALPGYVALYVYSLIKNKHQLKSLLYLSVISTFSFIIFFGGFAYLQNWINFGTPSGNAFKLQQERVKQDTQGSFLDQVVINSTRLSYQFLSCEGIPPKYEYACTKIKADFFRSILAKDLINIENHAYIAESNQSFDLTRTYTLNEDESWFGFHGWQIFYISLILGLIYSIKKNILVILILIFSSIFFFFATTYFIYLKGGWDPYIGRYLIFSIVLLMPLSSLLFSKKNKLIKLLTYSYCFFSLFTMMFCIVNNDSRPLISKEMFNRVTIWGSQNSLLVQKIGYKLAQFAKYDKSSWYMDDLEIRTFSKRSFSPVIQMLDKFASDGSVVGVLDYPGMVPDYYFFDESFDRKIIPLISIEKLQLLKLKLNFLLVSPDFLGVDFPNYMILAEINNWRLFIYDQ